MPKINAQGVPSYDGQQGGVTNAVGQQFEVNPSLDLNGERPDGYVSEPVGEFEESPATGLPGDVRPLAGDEPSDSDDEQDDDKAPRKGAAPKKTAPAADRK